MHQVKAYFKFLWKSTNQHGVHSPFVYELVTKCFYDKKKYSSYELLERYRRTLYCDTTVIEVTDFGAGSRVFKSLERKVADIGKNAGTSKKRARLLNRLVRYLEIKEVLELGTSVGLGTAAMASGNRVKVLSIEGCPETAGVARNYFEDFGIDNTEIRTGKFENLLASLKTSSEKKLDLIFLDGNHQKKPTLEYFNTLLPLAHNDSVFIFDDIHWSEEMEQAWEEIKANPAVRVSIDTFQWGFVFLRQEQEKQHFIIRT